jgi:hypothetical protein
MESQYFGDLPAYRGPGSALEPVTIFLAHLQEGARLPAADTAPVASLLPRYDWHRSRRDRKVRRFPPPADPPLANNDLATNGW